MGSDEKGKSNMGDRTKDKMLVWTIVGVLLIVISTLLSMPESPLFINEYIFVVAPIIVLSPFICALLKLLFTHCCKRLP